jgi:hypothetical protein
MKLVATWTGNTSWKTIQDSEHRCVFWNYGSYFLLYSRSELIKSLFNSTHISCQIFWTGSMNGRDIIWFQGTLGDSFKFSWLPPNVSSIFNFGSNTAVISRGESINSFDFSVELAKVGLSALASGNQIILFSDQVTAISYWNPIVGAGGDFGSYWRWGSNETVLVGGPYLVRSATISGSTLTLTGDLNATTTLSILAPISITSIVWNGTPLTISTTSSPLASIGFIEATAGFSQLNVAIPDFKTLVWKSADSLPEIQSSYLDNCWANANLATSTSTNQPPVGQFALEACDYGL